MAGTRYQAHVGIADVNGIAMPTPAEWGFTTTTTPICPCSLFSTATVPTETSSDDGGAYELGVRFSPSQSGQISGVRFYKGTGNTGTHTGCGARPVSDSPPARSPVRPRPAGRH